MVSIQSLRPFMAVSWHGGEGRTLCSSACCVATPWVRQCRGSRLHCTVGVDKPSVVRSKIRSSVVSVLISLISDMLGNA